MRSAQRRFARATGISYAAYRTIERARDATTCCDRAFPIIDMFYSGPDTTTSRTSRVRSNTWSGTRCRRSHARRDSCRSYTIKPSWRTFYGESKETDSMRFMTLIKSAEDTNLGPPPPVLFQAIARRGDEASGAGVPLWLCLRLA